MLGKTAYAERRENEEVDHRREKIAGECWSLERCGLTTILFKDILVRSLLDSEADKSMVCEKIAKRAQCEIEHSNTTVRGLGGGRICALGNTRVLIRTEDTEVELEFLVVPDSTLPYNVIIGEDILNYEKLCVKKVNDEKRLLRFPSRSSSPPAELQCNLIEELPSEVRQPLKVLLQHYEHMFTTGNKVRSVNTGELNIVLKENRTVRYQPYRLSFSQREEVRKIVDDLLENGIIRESVSPFASPIILVAKANGGVRMCVDYRALNKITVKDRYPLPLIDDQLDYLGKGKYFV